MSDCELCHDEQLRLHLHGGLWLCQRCRNWSRYWEALTPEQRRAEIESMDRYAAEKGCYAAEKGEA